MLIINWFKRVYSAFGHTQRRVLRELMTIVDVSGEYDPLQVAVNIHQITHRLDNVSTSTVRNALFWLTVRGLVFQSHKHHGTYVHLSQGGMLAAKEARMEGTVTIICPHPMD